MSEERIDKLSAQDLRKILSELEQLNRDVIQPLSEDEVFEIEVAYHPRDFAAERDERHRMQLEQMRQEWVSEFEKLTGIFPRASEVGISRGDLARQLRLSLDVLLKLELNLIKNAPVRLARQLADLLNADIRSVVAYLTQRETDMNQLAASSQARPAQGEPQIWREAILSSDMAEEDKQHWLETL